MNNENQSQRKKENNKKAPFNTEPSHLELGWVHFGWAALPNAVSPSPFGLHKSPGNWGKVGILHTGQILEGSIAPSVGELLPLIFHQNNWGLISQSSFLKKKKLWNDEEPGAPTRCQIHLASKSKIGKSPAVLPYICPAPINDSLRATLGPVTEEPVRGSKWLSTLGN